VTIDDLQHCCNSLSLDIDKFAVLDMLRKREAFAPFWSKVIKDLNSLPNGDTYDVDALFKFMKSENMLHDVGIQLVGCNATSAAAPQKSCEAIASSEAPVATNESGSPPMPGGITTQPPTETPAQPPEESLEPPSLSLNQLRLNASIGDTPILVINAFMRKLETFIFTQVIAKQDLCVPPKPATVVHGKQSVPVKAAASIATALSKGSKGASDPAAPAATPAVTSAETPVGRADESAGVAAGADKQEPPHVLFPFV